MSEPKDLRCDCPICRPPLRPMRFLDDHRGPEDDWTDPASDVTYPLNPHDVLSGKEYEAYAAGRRKR